MQTRTSVNNVNVVNVCPCFLHRGCMAVVRLLTCALVSIVACKRAVVPWIARDQQANCRRTAQSHLPLRPMSSLQKLAESSSRSVAVNA